MKPLVIRDTQTGVAGQTGAEFRLQPDGRFTMTRFVNDQANDVVAEGVLNLDELTRVVHFARQLQSRPQDDRSTPYEGVNPRSIALAVDESSTALALSPDEASLACADSGRDSKACRVLELIRLVGEITEKHSTDDAKTN